MLSTPASSAFSGIRLRAALIARLEGSRYVCAVRELIRRIVTYRHVLFELTLVHWKTRYKKAHLGFLWAFGNPLAMAFVLSFVFGRFLKYPEPNFPAFLLVALVPWWFFSLSVGHAVVSVWDAAPSVQRSYFPRELLPLSVILANLINFLLSMVLLLPFLAFYEAHFTWYALLTPLVVLLEVMLLTGIALIVSVMYVFVHDIRYIAEAGTLLLFYLSPVFYSENYVSASLVPAWSLNPMVGILVGFRHLLVDGNLPDPAIMATSAAVSALIFLVGVLLFARHERNLADHL